MTHGILIGAKLNSQQGDYRYRVKSECGWVLRDEGDVGLVSVPSLRILNVISAYVPELIRMRQDRGLRTTFEISDHIAATDCWTAEAARWLRASLRLADRVVFTTEWLARTYGRWAGVLRKSIAIGNIPPRPMRSTAPPSLGKPQIGWAGSSGHLSDMRAWRDVLAACCDLADVHVMGDGRVAELFAGSRVVYHRPGPWGKYMNFLRGLNVGLIPLCDTAFNRGRTDIKLHEMLSAGILPSNILASPIGPYAGYSNPLTPTRLRAHLTRLRT